MFFVVDKQRYDMRCCMRLSSMAYMYKKIEVG